MNKFMEISELCFVKVKSIWIAKRKIFQLVTHTMQKASCELISSIVETWSRSTNAVKRHPKQEVEAQMPWGATWNRK